jgi:hypothetical protein
MDGKWLVGRVVVVVGDGGVTDGAPDWSQEAAGSGRRDFLFSFLGVRSLNPKFDKFKKKKGKIRRIPLLTVCVGDVIGIFFFKLFLKKGIFFCHFYLKLTSVPCLFFFLGIDCKIKS